MGRVRPDALAWAVILIFHHGQSRKQPIAFAGTVEALAGISGVAVQVTVFHLGVAGEAAFVTFAFARDGDTGVVGRELRQEVIQHWLSPRIAGEAQSKAAA